MKSVTIPASMYLICIPLCILITLISFSAAALDPPHDASWSIGCDSCHDINSPRAMLMPIHVPAGTGGDNTLLNNLCISCHNPSGPATLKSNVVTHSSLASGAVGENWTIECWVCHSPHNQPDSVEGGELIRKSINLAWITDPVVPANKVGSKTVVFDDTARLLVDDDGIGEVTGICQVCHTETAEWLNDGTGVFSPGVHQNSDGTDCISCHQHSNGFVHGGGGVGCETCHGHEDGYGGSPAGSYFGSTQSHSTHTESDNDYIGPRPILDCADCHNTSKFPKFRSKADPNAVLTLAQTDICNDCHSQGGPYDGLDDAAVGARQNWRNGIYNGTVLAAGKERWCVTCHDSGTSIIGSRQAPDVAGNNTTWGYYASGHGSFAQECGACHGVNSDHNFDGIRTYRHLNNNYRVAFRLSQIQEPPGSGPFIEPLNIPNTMAGCDSNTANYRTNFILCWQCHDQAALLDSPNAFGSINCPNPFTPSPFQTAFRNESALGNEAIGEDVPSNIHLDHLNDINSSFGTDWRSDQVTTNESRTSCPACHNIHGAQFDPVADTGIPTKKMTRSEYKLSWGSDVVNGEYGQIGPGNTWNACTALCHGWEGPQRYYRTHPGPVLNSIVVTDKNASDPLPAEAGYTNSATVSVTFSVNGTAPTKMILSEDPSFLPNPSNWIDFSNPTDYILTTGDEVKTIYARVKDGDHISETKSYTITLDTVPPDVTASTVTSPNGGENWIQGDPHTINWNTISDSNIKAAPIQLEYSTDSGSTYPNSIASGETNDGTYSWTIPVVESTGTRVKVKATDRAGNQAADTSDTDFTIAALTPVLNSITLSDNNNSDPAPAETGYTNNNTIAVTIAATNNPAEMKISEDPTFADTPAWSPFNASTTFNITSAGDGPKTIYCIVQNGAGISTVKSTSIELDTIPPATVDSGTLTAPNGGEFWTRSIVTPPTTNSQLITWNSSDFSTDASLKANPVALHYSTDGGATYPNIIISGTVNDGNENWNIPTSVHYDTQVQLTVTDRAGNQSSDTSDTDFYISPPAAYIVTNTLDDGSPGSLRAAVTAINVDPEAVPGPIWFNIPPAALTATNGVATIILTASMTSITHPDVMIDAFSQSATSGETNPFGPEIQINGVSLLNGYTGLDVASGADRVVLKGMQLVNLGRGINSLADSTAVEGFHMGVASDNTGTYTPMKNSTHINLAPATNALIGAPGGEARNYLSCSSSSYSINDTGQGNQYVNNVFGLLPDDTTLCPDQPTYHIYVTPPSVNFNTNCLVQDNIICGGTNGVYLNQRAGDCTIKGNLFGLTYNADTWTQIGPQSVGIYLYTSFAGRNMIGGPNAATNDADLFGSDSNVINSSTTAIYDRFNSGYEDNQVHGNFIGTNPDKDENFGAVYGIRHGSSWGLTVGGTGAGEAANVIAHMSLYGIYLDNSGGKAVNISHNSFFDNGDEVDDDAIYMVAGANEGYTRPNITGATTSSVTVAGVVSGDTVEIYKSDCSTYYGSCADPTIYGEGDTFLGSAVSTATSVAVDISGAPVTVNSGDWLTAVRTKNTGSTSPFSANVQVP